MKAHRAPALVHAIDKWRKCRVYRARIGNSEVVGIVVKSARMLKVGKRISFARLLDLEGIDHDGTPTEQEWCSGVISQI
jgi:hypothetical protein